MPKPILPPAPAGSYSDLLRMARDLPDAPEKHVKEIANNLFSIAVHFLSRKHDAERDRRSARDERDRYEKIAASAKILRESLGRLASPGRLLGPLAQWVNDIRREHTTCLGICHESPLDTTAPADTASAAYAICWPSWGEKSHPPLYH